MRCLIGFLLVIVTAGGARSGVVSTCQEGPITDNEVTIWLGMKLGKSRECLVAIEEIAVVKLLARDARRQNLDDDPIVARRLRMIEATAWSEAAETAIRTSSPPPTDDEIAAMVAERGKSFERPARVRLRWILRSAGADDESAQIEARDFLEKVRLRILAGELAFEEAARRYSQSETRRRAGLAGTLAATDVSPQLAEIIFALEEGEVSEVISSSTGQNLFLVEAHISGRFISAKEKFDHAQTLLMKQHAERRWESFHQGVLRAANPQINLENLTAQDPDAVVLQLADGQRLTSAQTNDLATLDAEKAERRLTKMAFLLSIQEVGEKRGYEPDDEQRVSYELRRTRTLATELMERKINAETRPPTTEEIKAVWLLDRPKYRSEDRFRLWRARFDLTTDGAAVRANRLWTALVSSESESTEMEGVDATEAWIDKDDLIEMGRAAAAAVRESDDSAVIGTFRNGNDVWLIRVLDRHTGEPQPLEEISAAIASDLETATRQAVFSRVFSEQLANAQLKSVTEPSCASATGSTVSRIRTPN